MNKFINIIYSLLTATMFFACAEEELRVKYPASVPVFNSAVVLQDADVFMYGDTITVSVEVTDNVAPLSTLEIKVVVNDELIASESVRTKGNNASYTARYAVPFGPYMPDNAEVEVHLSSINVEGYHADTVLTNVIARRMEIPTMWLYNDVVGTAIELKLTDADNHIYSAEGLTFGNEISFLLPTKVTRFRKVDWTAPVFGKTSSGELGFVELGGDSLTLSDPTLIGFEKITLDLFNFTVKGEGKLLEPATEMDVTTFTLIELSSTSHLNVTTKENWRTGQIYLGKNTEMTISGISNLANGLTPDFFEVTGTDRAKFLGETGVYTIYYLPSADYLFVEQPAAVYPNALWLDGVGFGRPQAGVKTSSWNWNTPLEYAFCRKISTGVYQTTIYVQHGAGADLEEAWRDAFSAKFFHQRGWGGEEDARTYTLPNALLHAPTESDQGNFVGTDDLIMVPGVYRFTINTTDKTVSFDKIN